jgi:hypothetical protein
VYQPLFFSYFLQKTRSYVIVVLIFIQGVFVKKIVCEDTGEEFTTYSAYMQSKHWKKLKKRFKASKLARNCCWICDDKKNLHLHHKTYRRIGNEHLNELVELCEKCHFELHDKLNEFETYKPLANWNLVRTMRKRNIKKKKNKSQSNKKNFTKIKNKRKENQAWIKETQRKCPADIKYEAQQKLTKTKNGSIIRKK